MTHLDLTADTATKQYTVNDCGVVVNADIVEIQVKGAKCSVEYAYFPEAQSWVHGVNWQLGLQGCGYCVSLKNSKHYSHRQGAVVGGFYQIEQSLNKIIDNKNEVESEKTKARQLINKIHEYYRTEREPIQLEMF